LAEIRRFDLIISDPQPHRETHPDLRIPHLSFFCIIRAWGHFRFVLLATTANLAISGFAGLAGRVSESPPVPLDTRVISRPFAPWDLQSISLFSFFILLVLSERPHLRYFLNSFSHSYLPSFVLDYPRVLGFCYRERKRKEKDIEKREKLFLQPLPTSFTSLLYSLIIPSLHFCDLR
jgi:hypothetical protein